jgi:hypothetical protein
MSLVNLFNRLLNVLVGETKINDEQYRFVNACPIHLPEQADDALFMNVNRASPLSLGMGFSTEHPRLPVLARKVIN